MRSPNQAVGHRSGGKAARTGQLREPLDRQIGKVTPGDIMKGIFKGYHQPTEEEFSQLWRNALFVFDTNVLLNLYRYQSATRDQ